MKLLFAITALTTGLVSAYAPGAPSPSITFLSTPTTTTKLPSSFHSCQTGQTNRHTKTFTSTSTRPTTRLQVSPLPNGGTELVDLHYALDHVMQSSSAFLSDAAAATADVAEDGWWDNYISLYKTALTLVHSKIDQPLRDAGWDQTWGVSIFLFTSGVRSLLLPLSIQQTKSSEFIKALKPYQDDIKEKFKDNKDMLNRATAKLYEDANANPFAGCLVSLIQLPILLGLYRSVTGLAKDGQLQEPFLWIPSLEGPVSAANNYRGMQWLTEGWVDGVPSLGWEATAAFLVMPVVLVLGQKLTMDVLTPPTDDEDQSGMTKEEKDTADRTKFILKFLPLLIGYFSLQVPAGLTIYWFTSNLFTLTQSLVIRKYYQANPPDIELPDYWDALDDVSKMSPEDKIEAAKAGVPVGPRWEDLIDDAKFHYVVERTSLRESSPSWEKVSAESSVSVPTEMMAWVGGSNGESHSVTESSASHADAHDGEVATTTAATPMEPAQR